MSYSAAAQTQSRIAKVKEIIRNRDYTPLTAEEITQRIKALKAQRVLQPETLTSIVANDNEPSPRKGALASSSYVKLPIGPLASGTMIEVRRILEFSGKLPSEQLFDALSDLATCLEDMANGTATPAFYVSPVDPGVGKTLTIKTFIRELLKSEEHKEVGVLILLSRLADIANFRDDLDLPKEDFSIKVANKSENECLNLSGNSDPNSARVLLITHKMLEKRLRSTRSFKAIKEFQFHDKTRIPIWDEACTPARPIYIALPKIEAMKYPAQNIAPDLFELLSDFIQEVNNTEHQGTVEVPDLKECVSLKDLPNVYRSEDETLEDAIEELWRLSGNVVTVIKNSRAPTAVSYEAILPDDIKPMAICDASARVRETYSYWRCGRGDLISLRSGPKNYENADWFEWLRSGSKNAMKNPTVLEELLTGVAETINAEPDRKWLVAHHLNIRKKTGRIDVKEKLLERVSNPEDLTFIHYGGCPALRCSKAGDLTASVCERPPGFRCEQI